MDALLSPAESQVMQNFLSAMDYQDIPPPDWALYTSNGIHSDELIPTSQGSEALAKATKDLMSLDQSRWDSHASQQYSAYSPHHQRQTHQNSYAHRQMAHDRRDTFPFLNNNRAQTQHPMISITSSGDLHPHLISPASTSTPTSTTNTPATPHSPFGFSDPPAQLNHPLLRKRPPSPGSKRPSPPAVGDAPSTKRPRPSPPAPSGSVTAAGPSKQTLLSPLQKKANHIQSEQKRRANIRRGYEALCETVPALREAIREEEEAEARMNTGLGSSGKNPRSKRKKKDAGEGGEKDKIDGRAGPRSENVVLSKTIDYINELLSERSALLARLQRARSSLSPSHPVLTPACTGEPLWEREWKGGEGNVDGDDDDDENDNEGGDSM